MKLSLFITITTVAVASVAAQPPTTKGQQTKGGPSHLSGPPNNKQRNTPSKGQDPTRQPSKGQDRKNSISGSSACTYSPDYTCYQNGWPSCCGSPGGCPPNPPCDTHDKKTPSPTPYKKTPSPTPYKPRKANTPFPTYESSNLDGSSVCTYAPDYTCYQTGWPSCCNGPNGSCPRNPPCDKQDTTCVPDESPSVSQGGELYQFQLVRENARCIDNNGQYYDYGQIDYTSNFSDCAEACVKDVDSYLLESLRGINFNCNAEACQCLYDEGTLNRRNGQDFVRVVTRYNGYGPVAGARKTRSSNDFYCGMLVEESADTTTYLRSN